MFPSSVSTNTSISHSWPAQIWRTSQPYLEKAAIITLLGVSALAAFEAWGIGEAIVQIAEATIVNIPNLWIGLTCGAMVTIGGTASSFLSTKNFTVFKTFLVGTCVIAEGWAIGTLGAFIANQVIAGTQSYLENDLVSMGWKTVICVATISFAVPYLVRFSEIIKIAILEPKKLESKLQNLHSYLKKVIPSLVFKEKLKVALFLSFHFFREVGYTVIVNLHELLVAWGSLNSIRLFSGTELFNCLLYVIYNYFLTFPLLNTVNATKNADHISVLNNCFDSLKECVDFDEYPDEKKIAEYLAVISYIITASDEQQMEKIILSFAEHFEFTSNDHLLPLFRSSFLSEKTANFIFNKIEQFQAVDFNQIEKESLLDAIIECNKYIPFFRKTLRYLVGCESEKNSEYGNKLTTFLEYIDNLSSMQVSLLINLKNKQLIEIRKRYTSLKRSVNRVVKVKEQDKNSLNQLNAEINGQLAQLRKELGPIYQENLLIKNAFGLSRNSDSSIDQEDVLSGEYSDSSIDQEDVLSGECQELLQIIQEVTKIYTQLMEVEVNGEKTLIARIQHMNSLLQLENKEEEDDFSASIYLAEHPHNFVKTDYEQLQQILNQESLDNLDDLLIKADLHTSEKIDAFFESVESIERQQLEEHLPFFLNDSDIYTIGEKHHLLRHECFNIIKLIHPEGNVMLIQKDIRKTFLEALVKARKRELLGNYLNNFKENDLNVQEIDSPQVIQKQNKNPALTRVKVANVVFCAINLGAILVPAFFNPVATGLGFGVGSVKCLLVRFGWIGQPSPLMRYVSSILDKWVFFHVGSANSAHLNAFNHANLLERIKMLNLQFFKILIRINNPLLAFDQGYVISQELLG